MIQLVWIVLLILNQVFGVDTSGIVGPISDLMQLLTGGA